MAIIDRLNVLCESISNCVWLDQMCTINLQLIGTTSMFSEISYVFPKLLRL
jgi:hypothetical protein